MKGSMLLFHNSHMNLIVSNSCYHHYLVEFSIKGYSLGNSFESISVNLVSNLEMYDDFNSNEFVGTTHYSIEVLKDSNRLDCSVYMKNSLGKVEDLSIIGGDSTTSAMSCVAVYLSDFNGYVTSEWVVGLPVPYSTIFSPTDINLFMYLKIYTLHSSVSWVCSMFMEINFWFTYSSLGGNFLFLSTYVKSKEYSKSLGVNYDIYDMGSYSLSKFDGELDSYTLSDFILSVSSVSSMKLMGRSGSGGFIYMDYFSYNMFKYSSFVCAYGNSVKEDLLKMGLAMFFSGSEDFYFVSLNEGFKVKNKLTQGANLFMAFDHMWYGSKILFTSSGFKITSDSMYSSSMDPYEMKISK